MSNIVTIYLQLLTDSNNPQTKCLEEDLAFLFGHTPSFRLEELHRLPMYKRLSFRSQCLCFAPPYCKSCVFRSHPLLAINFFFLPQGCPGFYPQLQSVTQKLSFCSVTLSGISCHATSTCPVGVDMMGSCVLSGHACADTGQCTGGAVRIVKKT